MNLVILHRKLSTARELCKKYCFSVEAFPSNQSKQYCIQYMSGHSRAFLDVDFVSFVMRKALHYKTDQQRIVFKEDYQTIYYELSNVIVFNSEVEAKRALNNFMYYIYRRHGSLSDSVIRIAKERFSPF